MNKEPLNLEEIDDELSVIQEKIEKLEAQTNLGKQQEGDDQDAGALRALRQ